MKKMLRISTVYDNDAFGSADGVFQSTVEYPLQGLLHFEGFWWLQHHGLKHVWFGPTHHTHSEGNGSDCYIFFLFCLTLKTQWCNSPSDIWYRAERGDSQVGVTGEEQRSSATSNVAKWGSWTKAGRMSNSWGAQRAKGKDEAAQHVQLERGM